MFLLLCLFVFHIFMSWNPCYSQYESGTSKRILDKLINMIKEIFTDAIVKLEQIEVFKLEVEKHRAYKQGHLEYLVKDRYRRMLILYRHTDRLTQKNKDAQCINELVDMDNLYHDTMIFIEMMKMIEGVDNLAPIKPRFRSNTAQKEWREAADTAANDPAKLTKNPQSSETHPGKRSNGAWNYGQNSDDTLFK